MPPAGVRAGFNLPVVSKTNLFGSWELIIGTRIMHMQKRQVIWIILCTKRSLNMVCALLELIQLYSSLWMRRSLSCSKDLRI